MTAEEHSEQIEELGSAAIGKIVLVLSNLEFNLGLCLRALIGGSDVEAANPVVNRLSFKNKIDALGEVVEHKFSDNAACLSEFRVWNAAIDKYRTKRNSFVHGRWGVHHYAKQLINVAPGLPNEIPQRETRYTLDELRQELVNAQSIAREFDKWRTKWHV